MHRRADSLARSLRQVSVLPWWARIAATWSPTALRLPVHTAERTWTSGRRTWGPARRTWTPPGRTRTPPAQAPGRTTSEHLTASVPDDIRRLDEIDTELGGVDAALLRLSDGTYGTCELCGAALDGEALHRDPLTTRCPDHAA